MTILSLYWAPASPFVRKVMVSAHELGFGDHIDCLDSAANPVDRDPRVQAVNPLARVPAALAADGTSLFDSRVICEYLDSLAPDGPRLFPTGAARWTALRRQALADGVTEAGLLTRYERLLRPADLQWPLWQEKQLEKSQDGLSAMAEDLPASGEADIGAISYACALGWLDFRFPDLNWRAGREDLAVWFAGFETRASMQATRPKA